jgi:hypothetical protein
MPELRRLNRLGISRFADFLRQVEEATEKVGVPTEILTDVAASDGLAARLEIAPRTFADRMAAGKYLYDLFSGIEALQLDRDAGVWAWLSLFYFEQLCMHKRDGSLKPGEFARWVPSDNSRRYYRHLLAGPYLIYRAYRDAPESARIVLCQPVQNPGDFVEQLASRQEFIQHRAAIEAATLLYFDVMSGRPKRATSPTEHKPGTLRRFVDVVNQFELTCDLFSISGEDLIQMLPPEFEPYKPNHLRHGK